MRSRGQPNNDYQGQNSFANRPYQNRGNWINRWQSSQRYQTSNSYRGRGNLFCHCCGQPGHKKSDCWFKTLPEPWDKHPIQQIQPIKKLNQPHYLTAIVPACKTGKISLQGEKLFYVPLIFDTFHINALLDTGAFSSALPIKLFNLILKKEPSKILKSSETFPESVKMADGRVICVEKCVQIQITIGNCQFTEEFLIAKYDFNVTWPSILSQIQYCDTSL